METHKINHPDCQTICGDITEVTPDKFAKLIGYDHVDVVIGSPPCQTFSSLSQGKIKSLGKDIKKDIRNYYYKNYLDYITYFKPKVFLMENVPGFMTKYNGSIFEDFINYLKQTHPEYEVEYQILDAVNFSVPQNRKRLFVCGHLKEINFEFKTSDYWLCEDGENKVNVKNALEDLPIIEDDWRLDRGIYSKFEKLTRYQEYMRGRNTMVRNNICRVSNQNAKKMFSFLQPNQRYKDLIEEHKNEVSLFENFNSTIIQERCRRLPLTEPSWTVIAHIGMDGYEYIHPTEIRTISVREAARLQSFPDDYIFIGNMREQYVQIGNAVPPLLSYSIAKEIYNSLKGYTNR